MMHLVTMRNVEVFGTEVLPPAYMTKLGRNGASIGVATS